MEAFLDRRKISSKTKDKRCARRKVAEQFLSEMTPL
jgi:hypothetical protein